MVVVQCGIHQYTEVPRAAVHHARKDPAERPRRWDRESDINGLVSGLNPIRRPARGVTLSSAGGSGNTANLLGGPVKLSGSSRRLSSREPRRRADDGEAVLLDIEDERETKGRLKIAGREEVGFVPARMRFSGGWGLVAGGGFDINCDVDIDGLNRRGVVEPLGGRLFRDVVSSLTEGPAEDESFCDLLSVEDVPWLPLRFRL